jgi:S1-C subfamily serine protease
MSTEDGYGVGGLAEALNLPVTAGVLVSGVTPDSPASKAGLHGGTRQVRVREQTVCAGGDIIVAVNGTYVDNLDELVAYLVTNNKPGDIINLLIVRGSDTFEVPVNLEGRPDSIPDIQCGGS